jgi:hypothetical protein
LKDFSGQVKVSPLAEWSGAEFFEGKQTQL